MNTMTMDAMDVMKGDVVLSPFGGVVVHTRRHWFTHQVVLRTSGAMYTLEKNDQVKMVLQ